MFVSEAYAQAGGDPGGGALLVQFLPLILIFVVFYFLLIRPQQKRAREHRTMLGALRRGDRVVTGGGIVGTITKTSDEELTVEIAPGIKVRVLRGTVSTVLAKPEPARSARGRDEDESEEEDEIDEPEATPEAPADRRGNAGATDAKKGLGRVLSRR